MSAGAVRNKVRQQDLFVNVKPRAKLMLQLSPKARHDQERSPFEDRLVVSRPAIGIPCCTKYNSMARDDQLLTLHDIAFGKWDLMA